MKFTVHEEKGLTGNMRLGHKSDGFKMMVEVVVTKTASTVKTYRAFRPATPEDCELIRMRHTTKRTPK